MGLTCYRAMVFSDMPLGMHETFMRLRQDHPMIRKVAGLVVLGGDDVWGYAGGDAYGQGRLKNGLEGIQAVVDRLTSRALRLEHPEYVLDDDTHCLLVTTTDSEKAQVERLIQRMEQTMPERTRCDWLHIEWGPGLGFHELESVVEAWNEGDFDRNCIRNRTAAEKVEYGAHEWSAAVIQYLESRMLETAGAISLDSGGHQPMTFGFATLDFSQMEGRRFLEAKAFLDLVERENERVDLDKVYQRCSSALKGGKETYQRAKDEAGGPPDLDQYAPVTADYAKFDVRQQLEAFRQDIMLDGSTIERVERKVEELIGELGQQIQDTLNESSRTAQERLCVIRALLGEVSEYTQGKPLRPTLMLDDCEAPCLEDLTRVIAEPEEVPSVQSLHTQRRLCEELMDDIVNLERGIEIDREAKLDTESDEAELILKRGEYANWVDGYSQLRQEYTRLRRKMFTGLSTQWINQLFERLVVQAKYDYTPPEKEEKPLLSAREKRIIKGSLVTMLGWLAVVWFFPVFSVIQLAAIGAYILVWLVIISLRLRRPKVVHENPMVKQREKWREAAETLFENTVIFATVNRFQKRFDEEIRKPLIIEYNRLTDILGELRRQEAASTEIVGAAFTKVDFVQHIGDADSFNLYYERELAEHIRTVPSVVNVYLKYRSLERRNWTVQEAMSDYREMVGAKVEAHLGALSRFELLAFLMEGDRQEPPLFVKKGLGTLAELIRKAAINLEVLHDFAKGGGDLYVFRGGQEESQLVDQFKDEIRRLFPESASNNLHFVQTDDPNRVGFLRICEVDEEAMVEREALAKKNRKPRRPKAKAPSEPAAPAPPPVPEPIRLEGAHGTLDQGRFYFECRGAKVSIQMPTFSEEDERRIMALERWEKGVRYREGTDPNLVRYQNHLDYAEDDDRLQDIVQQARDIASDFGVSVVEVLMNFVQAIPYEVGGVEVQYPSETLMRCNGDCDEMVLLLKKLLGMVGVNSVLLLYDFGTEMGHAALGIEVAPESDGLLYDGRFVFVECTSPSIAGEANPLSDGYNPKDFAAQVYFDNPSMGCWEQYPEYREAASRGLLDEGRLGGTTIRNLNPPTGARQERGGLTNTWKEQS